MPVGNNELSNNLRKTSGLETKDCVPNISVSLFFLFEELDSLFREAFSFFIPSLIGGSRRVADL